MVLSGHVATTAGALQAANSAGIGLNEVAVDVDRTCHVRRGENRRKQREIHNIEIVLLFPANNARGGNY